LLPYWRFIVAGSIMCDRDMIAAELL
jgi:hypothetical protein